MQKLILSFLMFSAVSAGAQSKRMAHWYFGMNAGIDFSSGQPIVDNNGQVRSWEASSTISDLDGDLLFYTNGRVIWNKQHDTMLNGHQSLGDESALKGSLIAPLPGSNSKYYVFSGGKNYHIVDMNGDNGLGNVISRNETLLNTPHTTESVAGALHCNKTDYWITSRSYSLTSQDNDTMNFYVFLLNSNGLSEPVKQTFHFGERVVPYWDHPTFSPSGELFAYSAVGSNVFLFNFDTYTGTLTFKDSLSFRKAAPGDTAEQVYSTEFSPDETKLYVTYWKPLQHYNYIAQYDLTASNINASKVILDSIPEPIGNLWGWPTLGRMQLAPDGRIYVSRYRSVGQDFVRDTLDAILYPNDLGLAATFQRDFLPLNGSATTCGLPAFINSFSIATLDAPNCPEPSGITNTQMYNIKIYPNPATEKVIIDVGENFKNYQVVIRDIIGKEYFAPQTMLSPVVEFETTYIPRGIYIVNIYKDGLQYKMEKVIVK